MKLTLKALNRMVEHGVIDGYVIGGAVAAAYYLEPITTEDLDVFFEMAVSPSGLVSLSPLYRSRGYEPEGETVSIEGGSVQFLPVFSPLYEEAYKEAAAVSFDDVPVKVMTAEHLVAIMLDTGRPKDHLRVVEFLSEKAVKLSKLQRIIKRHGLNRQWKQFLIRHQLSLPGDRRRNRKR
jgi:hypothetical protein